MSMGVSLRCGGVEVGGFHQLAQSGVDGAAEAVESESDEGAVFAQQRDGVGYGGDGENLQERGQDFCAGSFGVVRFEQGLR